MTHPDRLTRLRGRLDRWITRETTSGALLLVAALIALVWANSPWQSAYLALSDRVIGPAAVHLDLPSPPGRPTASSGCSSSRWAPS